MKSGFILFFLLSNVLFSQQTDYNTKKGYVAEGYDVVAYFDNIALEGNDEISTEYDGVRYRFVSKEHLEIFKSNPDKYSPQYGGYCAYAVADKGKKVGVDPKSFQIMDGKLYLFYDSIFAHTLKSWNEEGSEKLKKKADINWMAMMKTK